MEIETDGSVQKLRVIGIVVEYVSLTEGSEDLSIQFNSGYSIVEPMDPILELAK